MAKYKDAIRWKKTAQGFTYALGYAGEHLTGWAREWMSEAVNEALSNINHDWDRSTTWTRNSGKKSYFGGSHYYPWYSGNLHDSVAGIVSDKNRIVAMHLMPEEAMGAQTYAGMTIIGHDWALRGAQSIQRALHFVPGIRATISVGVPYAEKVEESGRHAGYLSELSNQFASYVEDYFEIKAGEYRTRVFVADKKGRT